MKNNHASYRPLLLVTNGLPDIVRRGVLLALSMVLWSILIVTAQSAAIAGAVSTGAEQLLLSGFGPLNGKRVGLITNQTALIGNTHLADILSDAPDVTLAAIYAPEHGFRGLAEAGAKVKNSVDKKTGVRVLSLYGRTKKPTQKMLRGIDVLVFDIQDIGVRYYTYISTMGLAMEAAAEADIPFIVLDRPNPLGGNYVSGYVLEKRHTSFVGQFPIPIVHGMSVGELARMIKGERWLKGLDTLDLQVIEMRGWTREMRWPAAREGWVATSPNIPTFESALVYPGVGIVGLTDMNEGRGTPTPFSLFGATWFDNRKAMERLRKARLPGVTFKAETYVPRSIPNVALKPLFKGKRVRGVRVVVRDVDQYAPLEVGVHALVEAANQARSKGRKGFIREPRMFTLISGTKRLRQMIESRRSAQDIIASWRSEVARFRKLRTPYLLYK